MKKFLCAVMLALGCLSPHAGAQNHPAYGFLVGSDDYPRLINHLVTFDLDTELTTISDVMVYSDYTTAGDWVNGKYYVAGSKDASGGGEVADKLMIFDIDNGTFSEVAPITGLNRFINDMAYDNSRQKMYAVARLDLINSESYHALYTIDLSTGVATKIGTDLGRRISTLACSYDGDLYAVDSYGTFCSIDPLTGAVTEIGYTGTLPSGRQSMTFDHTTGTLYWAAMHRRMGESMYMDVSELRTIDVESGQSFAVKSMGSNTQIAGLYIPYTAAASAAPAHVSQLIVTPAADGANSATITWVNPSKLFGGGTLSSITKVEVYRDDVKVGEVTDALPGQPSRFVDNISGDVGALHTYKVMAWNAKGAGAPSQTTAFVGKDVPAAPTGVTATRILADAARISWEASAGGVNGGYVVAPVTYTVRRMPAGEIVVTGVTGLSAEDHDVTPTGSYYYEVTAVNATGTSQAAVTAPLTLGPAIEIPYYCDFTAAAFADWSVIDSNNDGKTWLRERNSANKIDCIRYDGSGRNQADDWAVLHAMNLKAGARYKLTYEVISYNNHDLDLLLLRDGDINDVAQTLENAQIPTLWFLTTRETLFTAEADGAFNLALHVKSPADRSQLMVSSVKIEEIVSLNLAATKVTGTPRPVAGNTYNYNVTVENKGTGAVSSYEVALLGLNETVLAKTNATRSIEQGQTDVVAVPWTVPADFAGTAVKARVTAASDGVPADDVSPEFAIAVQPAGSADFVKIGEINGLSRVHPFNCNTYKSAALNIYQASEIDLARGCITDLSWTVSSEYYDVPEMAVKVYLANTDRTKAPDGFLPESAMTLVYDGTVNVSMAEGLQDLAVKLDTPFLYTGGNLAVLTVASMPAHISPVSFGTYDSPVVGNSGYAACADDLDFKFEQTAGETRTGTALLSMSVRTAGAVVAGKVTDADGAPLQGVKILISQTGDVVYSDAEGNYRIEYLADGDYSVTFSLFGYPDIERNVTVAGNNITENVTMTAMPRHTVSGSVKGPDGLPISGASVTVEGYGSYSAVTDANGRFVIGEVVVCDNATVKATKEWYKETRITTAVNADVELPAMAMSFADYKPQNVAVVDDNSVAGISWAAPASTATFCYDSNEPGSQIGFNDHEMGTYTLGTAFREPVRLEAVQWMTTSHGGPHNVVHLYIYDLDENGQPTSTLLYSERSVRNVDDQFTTYTLPEAVDAPRGCLVALNYPGFIGLAIDDNSPVAPFRSGTYYFTSDMNTAVFSLMENAGLDANLMIRAIGQPFPLNMDADDVLPAAPASQPQWRRYRLWRESFNEGVAADEVLLSQQDLTATEFTDNTIGSCPIGVYRYKVAAVMPDGSLSSPAYSAGVLHRMVTEVTVPVATGSYSGDASGAEVTITDASGNAAGSAVVGESGQVVFTKLWKGKYNLKVSLFGYRTYSSEIDLSTNDSYLLPQIMLEELKSDPSNLQVVADEGSVTNGTFRWNESGEITDDFESYADFERHPSGKVAWRYIDADGATTVAEKEYNFPGRQQPHAFICFNPSATTPSMLSTVTSAVPHSGQKMLASFWGALGSDDYIISPELTYFTPVKFSLYARRRSANYLEWFRMGYSTTTSDPAAFTWGELCEPEYDGWLKFSLDVPADARYVAVHSVSDDGFILFLDDFSISSGSGMPMRAAECAPEVRYEVQLDGKVLGTTEECSFPLAGVAEGEHTASVTAVYGSGRSNTASIRFNLASALMDVEADTEVSVTPNPAVDVVSVSADFTEARLYSVSGQLLRVFDGGAGRLLRVADLPRGAHLLSVALPDGSMRTLRLILM